MKYINKNKEICEHAKFCGGCKYQGVSYSDQLKEKDSAVRELITAKNLKIAKIDEIEASPTIYKYRNKMEYTFGDFEKGGELMLGMHPKRKFMSVMTVDKCQLIHEDFNIILKNVLKFAKNMRYVHYNKKTHRGLLRHLQVRMGVRTNQLLVNIVVTSQEEFDDRGFVDMISNLHLENEVVGVLKTINDAKGDNVQKDEVIVLQGQDYYMENINNLEFKVNAFSFFQTNVVAAERLYEDAISLIDETEGKRVFDLFCGTGTISQIVARRGAKEVVGIEIVEDAVAAAKRNAKLNGLKNCEFICGDVFDVLNNVSDKPDVIIVDPPRAGIGPKALDKIISYGVEQIVYISCNPKSLVDNLYYMSYNGYEIEYLKPYDNFAFTDHVESVVLLTKVHK